MRFSNKHNSSVHRARNRALGVPELVAIALGGMIGGGIFTVLGISVELIGLFTPLAIVIGAMIAVLAAYSYVKLGVYYKDEGATYSFYKRTFPESSFAASLIGWCVIFGYISTLALYSYTFASYAISGFAFAGNLWVRKGVAGGVILLFTLVNLWSVRGMGKVEDIMVYTKLVILAGISFVLILNSRATLPVLLGESSGASVLTVLIVASVTFVAFEGFQLVINAVNEMERPERNIPLAIYSSILLTSVIYVVISSGAILAIPFKDIVQNKEYALASGAGDIIGGWGTGLVIAGALLATSSAISGTLFGASRQMAIIAEDGYLPGLLGNRVNRIPVFAIACMAMCAFLLVLSGTLELILEFASITFLLVSLLMTYANYKVRASTGSSLLLIVPAFIGLLSATVLIFYYEFTSQPRQMYFIGGLYAALVTGSWLYSRAGLLRNRNGK